MQKGLRLETSGIAFDPQILQDRDPWDTRKDAGEIPNRRTPCSFQGLVEKAGGTAQLSS